MTYCKCAICERDNSRLKCGWRKVTVIPGATDRLICPMCAIKLKGCSVRSYIMQFPGLVCNRRRAQYIVWTAPSFE